MHHIRRIFIAALIILILCTLSSSALAHSGRTDSNGGHYNRSTGEYHYHHGYSAHDHWDMDGDGDLDCPYKFDDQTNHNSGSNSSSNSNTTHQNKDSTYTFCYAAIGLAIIFFVFVNCWALHVDRKEKNSKEELPSPASVFISVLSTVIVFALLFLVMCIFKRPLIWREISFGELLQTLLFSVFFGSIVWVFSNWASLRIDAFLRRLLKAEALGEPNSYQRLTIPLSFAFMILLFTLQ